MSSPQTYYWPRESGITEEMLTQAVKQRPKTQLGKMAKLVLNLLGQLKEGERRHLAYRAQDQERDALQRRLQVDALEDIARVRHLVTENMRLKDQVEYSDKVTSAHLAGMAAFLDGEPDAPPAGDEGCQHVWSIGWQEAQAEHQQKRALVLAAIPIEALLFAHHGTDHLHPETMQALREAATAIREVFAPTSEEGQNE